MKAIVTEQLVQELKEQYHEVLQLPTASDISKGITIQQVAFCSGIKEVIDLLERASNDQKAVLDPGFEKFL